jgi:hypothetical protein
MWPRDRVVADTAPCDHIVQLYQGQDFLNRVVCRFTGAALTNGEGSTLVRTLIHWDAIHSHLIPGEGHARLEMRILRRRIVPGRCLERQSS